MSNHCPVWVACLVLCHAVAAEQPSATELLDRYAANQNRFKSFIVKIESTTTHLTQDGSEQRSSVRQNITELRYEDNGDDFRTYYSVRKVDRQTDGALIPVDQLYSYLWDRKRYYEYFWAPALDDRDVFVSPNKDRIKYGIACELAHTALGILSGDQDRFDSILRQSDSMSLRKETERIGSVDCYIIDAKSKHGTYTVWLDPEHGYGIAKAEVYKGPEHLRFGRPRSSFQIADDTSNLSVQNVRFDNVEGVWIPVEADLHMVKDEENRKHIFDTHYRITQMTLNPNHAKLGSFVLDIENGTKVHLEESPGIKYTWQDGKIVPDIDDVIVSQIDQMTDKVIAEGQSADVPNQPSSPVKTQSQQTADVSMAQPNRPSKPTSSFPVLPVVLIGCLAIGGAIWLVARRRTKG